jgi:hypothetical protein
MTIGSPHNPKAPDALEFELTDFDDARRAHEALPDGVDKLPELEPNFWEQRRRKPQPTDRALAGYSIDWLLALPPSLRPKLLCESYPRAVNAIAAAAPGDERCAVLAELLSDRRGRRHGFPERERLEIEALYDAALREMRTAQRPGTA